MINRSMKLWLQDNVIEIYSKPNKGKSVVALRFIRTLKKKMYKYMNAILYNITIKMNPVDFDKENKKEDCNFKVGEHVRIKKYKNSFAKCYISS